MTAVLIAAMALPLAGCSSAGSTPPELKSPTVSSPTIGQDGVLRVGVNTDQSPLAGKGNDKIIGIDVDIAAAIADELGLKLSIVDVGSDPVTALQENTVDIVMGVDSADSSTDYWLSDEYLPTAIALFATQENAPAPTKADAPSIAAQSSSKSAWAVTNEFGADAVKASTNLGDAFNQLSSDGVDYVASDAIIGLYAAHRQGVDAYVVALMSKPAGYCIAASRTNTDLQTVINEALSTLLTNGTADVIESKWLGAPLELDTIALTAGAQAGSTSSSSSDSSSGSSSSSASGSSSSSSSSDE